QECQSVNIDIQIQDSVVKNIFRRMDKPHHKRAEKRSENGKDGAQSGAGKEGRADGCLHLSEVFCPEAPGHNHGSPQVTAYGKRHKDYGNGVGSSHGGKGVFAGKPSGDHAVGYVVELLKNHTDK